MQEDAWVQLPRISQQYPYAFADQGYALRGTAFNVTVTWNVMPIVGRLYTRSQTFGPWTLDEDYRTLHRVQR